MALRVGRYVCDDMRLSCGGFGVIQDRRQSNFGPGCSTRAQEVRGCRRMHGDVAATEESSEVIIEQGKQE